MTNATQNTARNEVAKAVTSAYSGSSQASGAIARIATGILHMMAEGNSDNVTIEHSDKDVTVNADVLQRFVAGTLPKSAKEATDLPTANMLIGALADMSETYRNAVANRADHLAKSKKGGDPLSMVTHNAKAERLATAINSAKQPIRRALVLASYVINAQDDDGPRYNPAKTREVDGVLHAFYTTARDDIESCPISFAHAKKDGKPGKGADQNRSDNGTPPVPEIETVNVSERMSRTGGADRKQFTTAINMLTGIVKGLETAPTSEERRALQKLWAAIGDTLDDDALLEAAADADKDAA